MVNVKKTKKKTRNASASIFGWDFQTNAAILLMLENIKRADSVKVESQTEDIEIKLTDGNIIYSQAKSILNADDTANLSKKLKDAIKTLNDASKNDNVEKLIYITNHSNPLSDQSTVGYFSTTSQIPYIDLPKKCRNKIDKIIKDGKYDIDTNKIYIAVLPFIGSEENNRYKEIKRAVFEFIGQLNMITNIDSKKILDTWQKEYFFNSTVPDDTITITKKKMMWTLIVQMCEMDIGDEILEDCDSAQIQEIKNNYNSIINIMSDDFSLVSKVLGKYSDYKIKGEGNLQSFIRTKYKDFENEFIDNYLSTEDRKCLIQIILKKIILKRFHIEKIKEAANL
ncbi:MAG: hypothetical protein PHV37_06650 [Candidatus Gastranaerophilales bacterium]|nr:hypothetical protein [Candidatus Gastranaerophilales bacterium]